MVSLGRGCSPVPGASFGFLVDVFKLVLRLGGAGSSTRCGCGGLASGSSGVSPPVEGDVRGEEPEGVGTQGSGSSDEFHEEEWKAAEAKLRAVEVNTGLTFVQRARLRRQLSKGDIIDVPVFQQRYGSLPLWLTGAEVEGAVSVKGLRSGAQDLAHLFTVCGGVLLAVLGSPAAVWGRLRACCRCFRSNAVLSLVARVRDTGVEGGMPLTPTFQAPFRAVQVGDQVQWVPVAVQEAEIGLVGDQGETGASGSGHSQDEHAQQPPRLEAYHRGHGTREGTEGVLQGEPGVVRDAVVSVGVSVFADIDMSQPCHAGSEELEAISQSSCGELPELEAISQSSCGELPELEAISPSSGGDLPELEAISQSSCGELPELEAISQSSCGELPELEAISSSILEGSSTVDGFVDQVLGWGASGSEISSAETGFRRRLEVQGPGEGLSGASVVPGGVQFGGSSSSQDVYNSLLDSPREQNGASSSHGMSASLSPGTYEDYYPTDSHPEFPLVGTWLVVHYLVQVLSIAGVGVLQFLGHRADEWRRLRATSCYLRYGFVGAAADLLREGPFAVVFSGPQWVLAVEHYVCRGELLGYEREDEPEPTCEPVRSEAPTFPQVYWGPPNTVHYLWCLFARFGYGLLSFLGDRVVDWYVLRTVAPGFRSCVLYGLILWLERTSVRYRSRYLTETASSWNAAQTYLRTGQREGPFGPALEDIDRDDDPSLDDNPYRVQRAEGVPVRQIFVDSSSSSESSEDSADSTTEPSVVSASESSECLPAVSDCPGPLPLGKEVGLPVVSYAATEGALIVFYGDDSFKVPLEGWTVEEVQGVVEGLETGVWRDWAEVPQSRLSPDPEEANPSERLKLIRYGRLWGRLARLVVFFGVVLWFLLYGLRRVSAGEVALVEGGECVANGGCLQVYQSTEEATGSVGNCDGTTLEFLCKIILVVGTWEIVKRACQWMCLRRKTLVHTGSQTHPLGIVPMPLSQGIPNRGHILFSLWRGGYKIDAEDYSEKIRSRFHSLVGHYLSRVEEGLVSEGSSGSD